MLPSIRRLVLIVIALFAIVGPATAQSGSHAFVIRDSAVYQGPGTHYASGGTLSAETEVTVTRCSKRWCLLASPHAWISQGDLSFGQHARGPLSGPKFEDGRASTGLICLFDARNQSGQTLCLPSDTVVNDLMFHGWDNRISSVSVDPGTSVMLCRDRNLGSHCVLIDQNTNKLGWLIDNAATSLHVLAPRPY